MATPADSRVERRLPLSRRRVLEAAVALADRDGLAAVTMRNLARELGVEAMSLYHHVESKEDVLDGMAEEVAIEINREVTGIAPSGPGDWKQAVRETILTARRVLLKHRWAPRVLETRVAMNPDIVLYYDSLLGMLLQGGFSYDLAHHAMHALGSRALGFTQELFDPGEESGGDDEATALMEEMADKIPNLVGMVAAISHDGPGSTLGWCDDQTEFEFGLDLILDGLERKAAGS
ncbi:MAG: TetR/AcrR family transcriptional regulator C-terminal domain-containing protein [Actinomycetota bacterium]